MKFNKVGKDFFDKLNIEEAMKKSADNQQEIACIMDDQKPICPKNTMDENFLPIELLRYIIDNKINLAEPLNSAERKK